MVLQPATVVLVHGAWHGAWCFDRVVPFGHSYGGSVITQAGVHRSVRRLVDHCAFALAEAETCASACAGEPGIDTIAHDGRPNLGHAMVHHDDGTTTLTRDGARPCLYADVDDATSEWALARLGPQPMATLLAAPIAIAWRSVPSTYVVCTDDLARPAD